jgi:hypothetical protein
LQRLELINVDVSAFSICRFTDLTALILGMCKLGGTEPLSISALILTTITIVGGGLRAITAFHAPALVNLDLSYCHEDIEESNVAFFLLWNCRSNQLNPIELQFTVNCDAAVLNAILPHP